MANGPLGRILGGAQEFSTLREQGALTPLRRESAELSVQGQQLGVDRQESENQRFTDELQRTGMAEAAAEFLTIPAEQGERRRQFILTRADEILGRGGDPQDTLGMLNLTPEQQTEAAQATVQLGQQLGVLGRQRKGQAVPSAIQEFELSESLSPEARARFLEIKRAAPGSTLVEIGGRKGAFDRGTGQFTPLTTAAQEREAAVQATTATTTARKEAEVDVERRQSAPQRLLKGQTFVNDIDNVIRAIDQATALVGEKTAGFGGLLDFLPRSDARTLRGLVDTIKANVGFESLRQMREASKTGGALGNVTERELDRLEARIASLDRLADPKVLRQNLRLVAESYQRSRKLVIEMRAQDLKLDGLGDDQIIEALNKEFPRK